MAKISITKFNVEFTIEELFMIRILLRAKLDDEMGKVKEGDISKETIAYERLSDDLNIDKFR